MVLLRVLSEQPHHVLRAVAPLHPQFLLTRAHHQPLLYFLTRLYTHATLTHLSLSDTLLSQLLLQLLHTDPITVQPA